MYQNGNVASFLTCLEQLVGIKVTALKILYPLVLSLLS